MRNLKKDVGWCPASAHEVSLHLRAFVYALLIVLLAKFVPPIVVVSIWAGEFIELASLWHGLTEDRGRETGAAILRLVLSLLLAPIYETVILVLIYNLQKRYSSFIPFGVAMVFVGVLAFATHGADLSAITPVVFFTTSLWYLAFFVSRLGRWPTYGYLAGMHSLANLITFFYWL